MRKKILGILSVVLMTLALVCVAPAPAFANSAPVSISWSLHVKQDPTRTEPTAIGYWTQSITKVGTWSGNLSANVIDDKSGGDPGDFARVKGDLSASIPLADITGLNYWTYIISGDVNGKSDIGYGPGDTLKDPTKWSDPNYHNGYPGPWIQLNLLAGNSTAWYALEKAYVYSTSAYHTWVRVNITDATLFHIGDPTVKYTLGQLKASNPDTTLTAVRLYVGSWAGGTSPASELAGWYSALVSGLAISQSAPMIYHMAPNYNLAASPTTGIAEWGTTAYDGMRSARLGLSSYVGGDDYGRVAIEAGMLLKDLTSWSIKYNVEQGDVDGPTGSGYNPPAFKDPIIYSIDPLDDPVNSAHPYYNGYLAGYIGFALDLPPYDDDTPYGKIDHFLMASRYVATTALAPDTWHPQPTTESLGVWKTDSWDVNTAPDVWFHDETEANPFAAGHNFGFYTGTAKYGNARIVSIRYYMGNWGDLAGLSGAQSVFVDALSVSGRGFTANYDFEAEGLSSITYAIISAPEDSAWLIQPDFTYLGHTSGPKPTNVIPAQLSDYAASGTVIGMSSNPQYQILDTQSAYIDTTTGEPKSTVTGAIVMVTGPIVNSATYYYTTTTRTGDQSPAYYSEDSTFRYFVDRLSGARIDASMMPYSTAGTNQDNFIIMAFKDSAGRMVYIIYGFTWKGTYASAIFFKTKLYPNISAYTGSYYIFKWTDATIGPSANNIPDQGDTYTFLAAG